MIKVLVVDDSKTVRDLLIYILGSDPEIEIIGTVSNGKEAIIFIEDSITGRHEKPDLITMDILMPVMDGLEATRRIMGTYPLPIVIISSSLNHNEVDMTFQSLAAGAVSVLEKPKGIEHPDYAIISDELKRHVKLMSEVKVVRRIFNNHKKKSFQERPAPGINSFAESPKIELVAIGASTGGPPVLHTILSSLHDNFPVPILIVQHIAAGFLQGLVDWLDQFSTLNVNIAIHGEKILPGHVYLAPDEHHLGVDESRRIKLSNNDSENGLRPAVSHLFRSIAEVYGKHSLGILLTGMGKDGAQELRLLRNRGAITIAQDEKSSVVHGMPGEAIQIGAAIHVLSPEEIALRIKNMVK